MRRKKGSYKDDDIKLVLPDGWQQEESSSEGLLVFQDGHQHQLTIRVAWMRDPNASAEELLEVTRRLYDQRLSAERELLGSGELWMVEEVEFTGGTPLGLFSGADASGRMFMAMVTAHGSRIATAYLEGFAETPPQFLQLGAGIFQGLTIR